MRRLLLVTMVALLVWVGPNQLRVGPELVWGRPGELVRGYCGEPDRQRQPGHRSHWWVLSTSPYHPWRQEFDTRQGPLQRTNGCLHLALQGQGFFALEGGRFTRDGRFLWDARGVLRHGSGLALLGGAADQPRPVQVGLDRLGQWEFESQGRLTGRPLRRGGPAEEVAQLVVADFDHPEYLQEVGAAVFAATPDSGPARLQEPAEGTIVQGFLELSNQAPAGWARYLLEERTGGDQGQ